MQAGGGPARNGASAFFTNRQALLSNKGEHTQMYARLGEEAARMNDGTVLLITGHSLGGALAQVRPACQTNAQPGRPSPAHAETHARSFASDRSRRWSCTARP